MNARVRKLMLMMGAVAVGALWVPMASAVCANPFLKAHVAKQAWDGQVGGAAQLLMASDHDHDAGIVGLWHVAFIAEGNTGAGLPPDGAQVDSGLTMWHSDGTEETLDSRPPATGDVCYGVWKQVGERHYLLNHFGIAFDPSTDPNTPLGYAHIPQDVVVSRDGRTFTGTFVIDQYDATGNLLIEIKGKLVGTRITLGTTVGDLVGS
ncbi:MAG TPA: hypothetical protein VHE33_10915 [Acidobacteriaceae bacterium]|nr:hypothetical protein [Acidobacteriaceae bacterium]